MVVALREVGYQLNHKRIYRLMRELKISSVIRKKRRYFGKQVSVVFPNRLNRNFRATVPNQKLVTDITYIQVGNKFHYLCAIQDLFNNEIITYVLSESNDLRLVIDTLNKAQDARSMNGAILHSDQGFQFTHRGYSARLEAFGVRGSHSRRGNCLDNACIESFFSHFKTESIYLYGVNDANSLQRIVDEYVHFYNSERRQKRLGHQCPVDFRTLMAS